jgi:hypothetical protein
VDRTIAEVEKLEKVEIKIRIDNPKFRPKIRNKRPLEINKKRIKDLEASRVKAPTAATINTIWGH